MEYVSKAAHGPTVAGAHATLSAGNAKRNRESQAGYAQLSQWGDARNARYFVALFLDCDHRGLCEHGLNAVREDAGYADRNA